MDFKWKKGVGLEVSIAPRIFLILCGSAFGPDTVNALASILHAAKAGW